MINSVVAGVVALLTAALLYIGAHDWAGISDGIIMDNALASAGVYGLVEDQWYYGSGGDSGTSVFGQTASDIKMLCAQMGSTYLPP